MPMSRAQPIGHKYSYSTILSTLCHIWPNRKKNFHNLHATSLLQLHHGCLRHSYLHSTEHTASTGLHSANKSYCFNVMFVCWLLFHLRSWNLIICSRAIQPLHRCPQFCWFFSSFSLSGWEWIVVTIVVVWIVGWVFTRCFNGRYTIYAGGGGGGGGDMNKIDFKRLWLENVSSFFFSFNFFLAVLWRKCNESLETIFGQSRRGFIFSCGMFDFIRCRTAVWSILMFFGCIERIGPALWMVNRRKFPPRHRDIIGVRCWIIHAKSVQQFLTSNTRTHTPAEIYWRVPFSACECGVCPCLLILSFDDRLMNRNEAKICEKSWIHESHGCNASALFLFAFETNYN